jgi:hypothetical protein
MTPNWQPIEALSFIAGMLDDQLQSLHKQVGNLERCQHRPGVLDRETVSRLQAVFGEQQDSLPVFREQLVRWLDLPLDEHQRFEINRLNAVLDQMKDAIKRILLMAENGR